MIPALTTAATAAALGATLALVPVSAPAPVAEAPVAEAPAPAPSSPAPAPAAAPRPSATPSPSPAASAPHSVSHVVGRYRVDDLLVISTDLPNTAEGVRQARAICRGISERPLYIEAEGGRGRLVYTAPTGGC